MLLVTHRLFRVPILHQEIFSINGQLFVFEEDSRDGIAIDFEIEVVVGRFNFKRTSLNRVDWHLESDSTRIGCIWKQGRTIGSCRRLEMLVDRLKCDFNILHTVAVFVYNPDADLAGAAGLASKESKRSLLPPSDVKPILPTPCYSTLRSPLRAAVVTLESGTLDT